MDELTFLAFHAELGMYLGVVESVEPRAGLGNARVHVRPHLPKMDRDYPAAMVMLLPAYAIETAAKDITDAL